MVWFICAKTSNEVLRKQSGVVALRRAFLYFILKHAVFVWVSRYAYILYFALSVIQCVHFFSWQ